MKGMELSLTMVTTLIISIFVLSFVLLFFSSQSRQQMTESEANRVFYTLCDSYKNENFAWSVTKREDFSKFITACQILFLGSGRFSCLYNHCAHDSKDIGCDSFCNVCRGNTALGITTEACCSQFSSICKDFRCGVC